MGADVSQIERLNKRGIVAFEVDGVLARFTAKHKKGEIYHDTVDLQRPLVELGAQLAAQIRERVSKRGDLAGQTPSKTGRAKIVVSADYAAKAHIGGADNRYGKTIVGGNAALHQLAGTVRQSYDVTGGLWQGLQARASGRSAVILDFAGTSEGRGKPIYGLRQMRTNRSDGSSRAYVTKKTLTAVLAERVRNQWKAGGIFDQQGVHLLLPSDAETVTMGERVAERMGEFTALQLRLRG